VVSNINVERTIQQTAFKVAVVSEIKFIEPRYLFNTNYNNNNNTNTTNNNK
jgi:hypothetical protein